ncbi:glycosyltransferase [Solirhodobacter olei]|uniref:glycosyltransferase n=1 Tax=Solirhodobacter olei TaxID=2493082 RepID=UPI000FD830EA|nr:glycosyltransferase [Solirhodobacter olei]
MTTRRNQSIPILWLKSALLAKLSKVPFFSHRARARFSRSAEKRRKKIASIVGEQFYFHAQTTTPSEMEIKDSTRSALDRGLLQGPRRLESIQGIKLDVQTDIEPQYATSQILVVCLHAPTVNHAGGLRILDMIRQIKSKHPHVYVELFTAANLESLGPMGEASQIFDNIVLADGYNFSVLEYLRRARHPRYFDVIDFQFPQPPEIIESYRKIGRRLIFTPMESHIRNECIERGTDAKSEGGLTSGSALEEARICRVVDQTICVSMKDCAAIRSFVEADVVAIETGISEIEFSSDISPIDQEDHAVCYVAYFGSDTNKDALRWYLNEVHPKVRAAVPEYEFRIIGRGDISDILPEQMDGIKHIGEVDHIAPHVMAGAVGIAPALSGAGFRGKINQYAHLNVPAVASPLSAEGLAYIDGESILIAERPSDFAECVVTLLTDPETRRSIAAAAAVVCRCNYSWDSKWPQIADSYGLPARTDLIEMPTVHAVVPSYQHAAFIEERLRSIFDQQYPNIRVTVIDDHSTDGSHEILERLRNKYNFEYIRREQQSGSPFSAWKYAAANTKEDLIWICESDDSCDPLFVGRLVRYMTTRRAAKIAYCASWYIDDAGEYIGSSLQYHSQLFHKTRWSRPFIARGDQELWEFQRFGMIIPNMSGALFDADVFRAAFTNDVCNYKLAGDWLFAGQAMLHGDVIYIPELLNKFRQHGQTARIKTNDARRMAEHISVRLNLSKKSGASEREVLQTLEPDLEKLLDRPEIVVSVLAELRALGLEYEVQLVALLAERRGKAAVDALR